MARDRQRAKQRQAERRAARLAEAEQPPGAPTPGTPPASGDGSDQGRRGNGARGRRGVGRDSAPESGGIASPGVETETGADLAAAAPPDATGRSDTVLENPPPPPLLDDSDDGGSEDPGPGAGAADEGAESDTGRNKVIAFLVASWAELQRVQWPNRQQTTTLTGIVLGFVVVMGIYLGALDYVFAQLIQLIL